MSVVQHASGMHCWSICTFGYILTFSSDLLTTNYVVDKDYCRWETRVFCDFCCESGDNINTYIYLSYSKIYRELIEIQTSSPPDIHQQTKMEYLSVPDISDISDTSET